MIFVSFPLDGFCRPAAGRSGNDPGPLAVPHPRRKFFHMMVLRRRFPRRRAGVLGCRSAPVRPHRPPGVCPPLRKRVDTKWGTPAFWERVARGLLPPLFGKDAEIGTRKHWAFRF